MKITLKQDEADDVSIFSRAKKVLIYADNFPLIATIQKYYYSIGIKIYQSFRKQWPYPFSINDKPIRL
jgi:hypothetical protein